MSITVSITVSIILSINKQSHIVCVLSLLFNNTIPYTSIEYELVTSMPTPLSMLITVPCKEELAQSLSEVLPPTPIPVLYKGMYNIYAVGECIGLYIIYIAENKYKKWL